MAADVFTKELLHEHIRKLWKDRGFEIAPDDHVGVTVGDLIDHSRARNDNKHMPYVEIWVSILDECISWLISLMSAVYSERNKDDELTEFEKAATLILSKIIADSSAIRNLIILGYDTSARTILRSVAEYMEVFVAILHDPSFAVAFNASDTPEEAQRFWEQHLRGGKIRRRVTAAWLDFFGDGQDGSATWFANWGRGSQTILSGICHPSSAGGLFAAVPQKVRYDNENWLGIWGDKADISCETIYIYAQYLFPILLLSRHFPFQGWEGHISRTYDENEELHRHIHIGRDVLASVILSLGKDTNAPHLFPEMDMSIWIGDGAID